MSYDIHVCDKNTCESIALPEKHYFGGGTFAADGTTDAWLNITYNYGDYYYKFMDEDRGIRAIYDIPLQDAINMLDRTIEALGDEPPDPDYWRATAGNARKALENLKVIAEACLKAYPNREMEFQGD